MRIQVDERCFKAPHGLRNYVGLRLMSVLDHLVRRVDAVTVYLTEVRAPDGTFDKRCRMLARLAPSGDVHVEETDDGLYAAIDSTAQRLADGVASELTRQDATARILAKRHAGTPKVDLRFPRAGQARRPMGSR